MFKPPSLPLDFPTVLQQEVPVSLSENGPDLHFKLILDQGRPKSFRMGSRESEDEQPVHKVRLTEPYYLTETPVTQEQFAVWTASPDYAEWLEKNAELLDEDDRGSHQNAFSGEADLPAEQVSWYEAVAFCEWLTARFPKCGIFTLPSEAQWEFACRAGTKTDYWAGDGESQLRKVGWFAGNAKGKTHPVKVPDERNPFGLYGLHGNVQEWCRDYCDRSRYRRSSSLDENPDLVNMDEEMDLKPDAQIQEWADLFSRLAEGEGEMVIQENDVASIELFRNVAQTQVAAKAVGWEKILWVTEDALSARSWPEEDRDLLSGMGSAFKKQMSSMSGESDPFRVLRGGSWVYSARLCRSAFRFWIRPGGRFRDVGFRLGLFPGPGPEAQVKRAEPATAAEGDGTERKAQGVGGAEGASDGVR